MFKGWFKKGKKSKEVEEDIPDDQELEKQGFDPEQDNQIQEYHEEAITDFSQDYPGYLNLSPEEIMQLVKDYKITEAEDLDLRHEEGHKKGGRICADAAVTKKLRSVGKYMLKQVGKKIITGSMNLTKISFPISAMIPKTALETSVHYTCLFPLFLNKAADEKDPLERLKLVVTSCLASFFFTNTFLKPLNPILGETLHGTFPDGTEVFGEQISHHPPVSYFYCIGAQKKYKYHGYYDYDAKAGMNSVQILNKGKRYFEFHDGQKIKFNFPNETYSGTFMGSLKQESVGKMHFTDEANEIHCTLEFGKVKKRPSDFFNGKITVKGQEVCSIQGTYLGYIDFDNKRYWDITKMIPQRINFQTDNLGSDHKVREDLRTLKTGDIHKAQIAKEKMEEAQRADRKMREKWEKEQKKLAKQNK